jgi:nicotinate-nucleotide adenylyltransferase
MKTGIFGGTFNPVHRCHLIIAAQVRDRLQLDRVIFIPSGDPPHKPTASLAPARHRLEMVRRAIATEPTFSVSDIEIRRPSKSYSIDTVRRLHQDFPNDTIYFIVGLDAFLDFPSWRSPAELLRLCHFVVVSRPGTQFRSLAGLALLPSLPASVLEVLDLGAQDIHTVLLPEGASVTLLRLAPCDASASDIRQRIRTHRPVSKLLPASVESYIIQSKLYQEETDRTGV